MAITPIGLGSDGKSVGFELDKLNRHGIIAGATGTGKTVTMKVITEQLLRAGVPVFLADIKGDLASISQPSDDSDDVKKRVANLKENGFVAQGFKTQLWDIFGQEGTPVRATVQDFGPLLLARILNLTDAQEGVLNVIFKIAEDKNMSLIDLKDLQAMVQEIGDNNKEYTTKYGNIQRQTVGSIQRNLLVLDQQGGADLFGQPSLDFDIFFESQAGQGIVNILMAKQLFNSPRVYSTFLIYLLSRLFSILPEVGDLPQPKLVFFFDEAHLLFDEANSTFINQVEQTVRLIRSRGVGVFFVTQNPSDIPSKILSQLSNRVQHNLNAYSASDMRGVKAAADSFRPNPKIKDLSKAITNLEIGEALVSFLDESGKPEVVEKAKIYPPESQMAALTDTQLATLAAQNPYDGQYRNAVDGPSAYEQVSGLNQQRTSDLSAQEQAKVDEKAKKEAERNNPVKKYGNMVVNTTIRSIVYRVVNAAFKTIFRRK